MRFQVRTLTSSVWRVATGAIFRATSNLSGAEVRLGEVEQSNEEGIEEYERENERTITATPPWSIRPALSDIDWSEDPRTTRGDDDDVASMAVSNSTAAMSQDSSDKTCSFVSEMRRLSLSGLSVVSEAKETNEDDDIEESANKETSSASEELPVISLDQVAEHCYSQDAWMVIFDKVYDVTEFLHEHPGGVDVMQEYIGYDASLAFRSVGHSEDAVTMLADYLIGELPENERLYAKSYSTAVNDESEVQFPFLS